MRGRLNTLRASVLSLVITYVIFEVFLRFAQGGCYNYVPYRLNGLIPTLPPSADFCSINAAVDERSVRDTGRDVDRRAAGHRSRAGNEWFGVRCHTG